MNARSGGTSAGFALLFLLVLLAGAGTALVVWLGALMPPQAAFRHVAEQRLALVRAAAVEAYAQTGSYPSSLDTLASQVGLPATGAWRTDPYGWATDLDYVRGGSPQTLTVRSRGIDQALATTDDLSFTLVEQVSGRSRSRNRLRLLRASAIAWQLTAAAANAGSSGNGNGNGNNGNNGNGNGGNGNGNGNSGNGGNRPRGDDSDDHDRGYGNDDDDAVDVPPLTDSDRANLRLWSRSYWIAMRARHHVDAAAAAALTTAMSGYLTNIRNFRATYGVSFPSNLTGTAGLMQTMGLADALAVDSWSRTMTFDEAVGGNSNGGDANGGTSDDF